MCFCAAVLRRGPQGACLGLAAQAPPPNWHRLRKGEERARKEENANETCTTRGFAEQKAAHSKSKDGHAYQTLLLIIAVAAAAPAATAVAAAAPAPPHRAATAAAQLPPPQAQPARGHGRGRKMSCASGITKIFSKQSCAHEKMHQGVFQNFLILRLDTGAPQFGRASEAYNPQC